VTFRPPPERPAPARGRGLLPGGEPAGPDPVGVRVPALAEKVAQLPLGDEVPELLRLAGEDRYRLAVVELWDSVEPQAMAGVIAAAGAPLALTGVATVIDPALVLPYLSNGDDLAAVALAAAPTDQRTVADTFARQLEYPTVIAVGEDGSHGQDVEAADGTDHALLRRARRPGSGRTSAVHFTRGEFRCVVKLRCRSGPGGRRGRKATERPQAAAPAQSYGGLSRL
jgi:hypothetical protein